MANSYKKVGNKNVAMLEKQKTGANTVAENAYNASVTRVNNVANEAKQKALINYNASRQRLGKTTQTGKNKLEVGYGKNVAGINTARTNAENALSATKATTQAANTQAYYTAKANSIKTYGKAQIEKKEADRKKLMQTYKSTVSRFNTIAKCDAAIKRLKRSSDPNKKEKIAYIQNQRANLKAQHRSGGGGGWGYGGGGWSRYSSGGGSGDGDLVVYPEESNPVINAASKVAKIITGITSSGKTKSSNNKTGKAAYAEANKGSISRNRSNTSRHWHL